LSTFTEAIGGMAGIQISSRLFQRIGPRPLMGGGLGSAAVFVALMAMVDGSSASWAMPVLMFCTGMAFGFAMAPAQVTSLAGISRADTAQATTLTSVLRQAGSALGVALVATSLALMHPSLGAYHASFGVAAFVLALGSWVSWRIRKADALAAMVTAPPEPVPAASGGA
jgi:MFS family permease